MVIQKKWCTMKSNSTVRSFKGTLNPPGRCYYYYQSNIDYQPISYIICLQPKDRPKRPKQVQRLNRYPTVQQAQQRNRFSNGYSKAVEHLQPNFAVGAGGAIWDETLNRMAKYRDLINHTNPTIKDRWPVFHRKWIATLTILIGRLITSISLIVCEM